MHSSGLNTCKAIVVIYTCMDVTNTGNGEPGTGVWELVYSSNRLRIQNGGQNKRKDSKRNNLGKREFLPVVYVLARAESD